MRNLAAKLARLATPRNLDLAVRTFNALVLL